MGLALRFVAGALFVFVVGHVHAGQPRSAAAKAEFQRQNPCPSTGERRGKCPGWVIDHVVALACAKTPEDRKALDAPENMQWQQIEEAKEKDKWERKVCGGD